MWEDIKEDYELFSGRELRQDFASPDELVDYYTSLENKMIVWRDEQEYIMRLRDGMSNARILAAKMELHDFVTEEWIGAYMGEVNLYGRADILREGEIIDIKTGNEWQEDEIQMRFYGLIYYLREYRIPKMKLVYLLSGRVKNVPINLRSLESLLAEVMDAGKGIRNQSFPRSLGEHCNLCPYRMVCDYQTLRKEK